jgi:hypothetical protein
VFNEDDIFGTSSVWDFLEIILSGETF